MSMLKDPVVVDIGYGSDNCVVLVVLFALITKTLVMSLIASMQLSCSSCAWGMIYNLINF